jgi:hypothetical protein
MARLAAREPTAVLVVAAWLHGSPPVVAARITYTLDVSQPERSVVTVVGVDEIAGVVRTWLDDVRMLAPAGDGPVTGA